MRKRWQPPRPLQELLLVKMGSGASYRVSSVGKKGTGCQPAWGQLARGMPSQRSQARCTHVHVRWSLATPSSLDHSWGQGEGEGTWVLTIPDDTYWLDARKLSAAGRVGLPDWEVWQLEKKDSVLGLCAPFSTHKTPDHALKPQTQCPMFSGSLLCSSI